MGIELQPLAIASNRRQDLSDDFWGDVLTEIELLPGVPDEALDGIETFSHIEIIYYFDRVDSGRIVYSGHPRGNKAWPRVGIFAQRKKDRPNRLGLTIAELVERQGRKLTIRFFDGIDGTPILDIKPVMKGFLPDKPVRQPAWADELMQQYWLPGEENCV